MVHDSECKVSFISGNPVIYLNVHSTFFLLIVLFRKIMNNAEKILIKKNLCHSFKDGIFSFKTNLK